MTFFVYQVKILPLVFQIDKSDKKSRIVYLKLFSKIEENGRSFEEILLFKGKRW